MKRSISSRRFVPGKWDLFVYSLLLTSVVGPDTRNMSCSSNTLVWSRNSQSSIDSWNKRCGVFLDLSQTSTDGGLIWWGCEGHSVVEDNQKKGLPANSTVLKYLFTTLSSMFSIEVVVSNGSLTKALLSPETRVDSMLKKPIQQDTTNDTHSIMFLSTTSIVTVSISQSGSQYCAFQH